MDTFDPIAFDFDVFEMDVTGADVNLGEQILTVCALGDQAVTACAIGDQLLEE